MKINDKKKFDGMIFRLIRSSKKKSLINKSKEEHKKSGWLVRVTEEEGTWCLWRRVGKTLHPPNTLTTYKGNFFFEYKTTIKELLNKKVKELHQKGYLVMKDRWTNDDNGKEYYTVYKRHSKT